ncbi:MAG TPA: hypothetical protein VGL86_09485, partial [Polyangia bacterium]
LVGRRAVLALAIGGMALAHASLVATIVWAGVDPHAGLQPLSMLAPLATGIGLIASGMVLDNRARRVRARAIDAFNDAAARENRCPPTTATSSP